MNHSKFVSWLILLIFLKTINSGVCPTDQTKLILNCEACDTTSSNTICTKCLPSYFLSSNNCVSCDTVITNCNLCTLNIDNNPKCIVCKTNYGILNGGCQNCSAISGCSQCQILNYQLQCVTCNQGLILFSAEMTCIPCQIPYCSNCSISNAGIYSCSACSNGYYLLNSTCFSCASSISYCMTCLFDQNKRLTCTSCASNLLFLANNTCLANCTRGGYSLCSSCEIVSLATNSMTCSDCKSGYYLDSTIKNCLPCSKVLSGCSQCSINSSSDGSIACLGCTQQYFLASNPASCVLCTTIKDKCRTCNFNFNANSGQCTSCESGYYLNSATLGCDSCSANSIINATYPNNSCKVCQNKDNLLYCLVCTSNYYLSGQTCMSCSSKIAKCDTCSQNTTFTCITCILGYILSSPNQCSLCANVYPNCKYCNNNQCTDCLSGFYTLDNKKCLVDCNVSNCKECLTKDNTKCSTCSNGYQTTYLYTCKMITCNFPLSFNGRQCICPFQSYHSSSSNNCQSCGDNACQICPDNNCQLCLDGYYLGNGGGCSKCMTSCRFCNASDYCFQCDAGYRFVGGKCNQITQMTLQTGGIFYYNNFYRLCGFGCSECSSTACLTCEMGYFLNGTSCYFCPSNCLFCNRTTIIVSSTDPNTGELVNKTQYVITCIRCRFGLSLVENSCLKCTDSNCVRCDFNINFCILCSISYTSDSNGICKSCAQNCNFCDNDGVGTCDDDSCFVGFAKINKTTCIRCLGGCASCKNTYPFECIGCLLGTYSSASSNFTCINCPYGCSECTNSTNCIACNPYYKLVNGKCNSLCILPCIGCDWSGKVQSCSQCLQGYTLIKGVCQPNFSCMSSNICEFCPLGYFAYRGQCYSCPSSCIQCIFVTQDPSFVISGSNYLPFVSCQRCNQSYYLDIAQNCKKCSVNCLYCYSAQTCEICASSYFLEYKLLNGINNLNYSSGICTKCFENCAQCANSPNRCISCNYGSYLSDFTCRSIYNISFRVSLTSTAMDSATLFTSIISNLPTIFKQVITSLGASFSQKNNIVIFNSIQNGSVIISGTAEINNNTNDPSTVYNSASTNTKQTTTINNFKVVSYGLTANGFTPSDTTTTTTTTDYLIYIIIGSCIGGVLIIAAIICLCLRARKKKEENASEGQKFQTQNNEPTTSKNMLKSDNLYPKTVHQNNEISKKGKKAEVSHISGNRTNIMIPQKDQNNDKRSRKQIQLSVRPHENERNTQKNTKYLSRQDERISRHPQRQIFAQQRIVQVQKQSSSKQRSKSRPKTSRNIQNQYIKRDTQKYRSSNDIQIQHFESHSFRNQIGSNQINKLKNESNYEDDKKTQKKMNEANRQKQKKNAISRKYIPNQNTFFI